MSEASSQATLKFSEELLCRPPEQRNDDDILRILPWIRHKSPLFKNLEDGKCIKLVFRRLYCTVVYHCYFPSYLSSWAGRSDAIAILKHNISQHHWTQLFARIWLPCCDLLIVICWVSYIELVRMPGRNAVARTWLNEYDIMQHAQMLHEKFDHFEHHSTCWKTSQ